MTQRSIVLSLLLALGLAAAVPAEVPDSAAVFIAEKPVLYGALKSMVRVAKKNIFVRIFVVSDNDGVLFCSPDDQQPMADEFASLLLERKRALPELDIVVILDPINFVDYHQNFEFPWQRWAARLRAAGKVFKGLAEKMEQAIVVNRAYPARYEKIRGKKTIRERLREGGITVLSSNVLLNPERSALFKVKPGRETPAEDGDLRWRTIQRLPHEYPAVGDRIALERKLTLYQAYSLTGDHRKFAVIDDGTLAWNASMNVWDCDFHSPDDGVVCSGALARDMLAQFEESRKASLVMYEPLYRAGKLPELAKEYAGRAIRYSPSEPCPELEVDGRKLRLEPARGRLLRDGAIAAHLIDSFDRLAAGSSVEIYQTLITDPNIVRSIVEAARRGVHFRILTESYESVYGHDISFTHGLAFRHFRDAMLAGHGIQVKAVVPDPRVSEIHRKFALVRGTRKDGTACDFLVTGSANFSVHSADGSELEMDVLFTEGAVRDQARDWFDAAWGNKIEGEKNMVPRLIREDWRTKDLFGSGMTWMLALFGLGG